MSAQENFVNDYCQLRLDLLKELQHKPPLFAPGESLFWNDPHISKQMLKAHLDPTTDAASYRPETISRSINWLVETLKLRSGAAVLDLGCGPGLYAARLTELGFRVTGVDYSRRSIDYAKQFAKENNLDISYRFQDYFTLEEVGQYEVVLLISGDFCPLPPDKRANLLRLVHRALKDGGYFIFDVSTPEYRKNQRQDKSWYFADSGFWRSDPHLVLEQRFDYPKEAVHLDQFIVIELDGMLTVYRNWLQDFTQETISSELRNSRFLIRNLWSDLIGTPFDESSEWKSVAAQKE